VAKATACRLNVGGATSTMQKSAYIHILLLAIVLAQPAAFAGPARAGAASAFRITSEVHLLSGQYADGEISDLMMENDRIAIVIADIDHIEYNGISGGHIIDAGSAGDRIDALAQVYPFFDNDWPRQAVYDSIAIIDDGGGDGPAVVRAYGVDSRDPSLKVITEYSLGPDVDHVILTTRVSNTGGSIYEAFELGDAFAWVGCEKYAPGYGFSLWGLTREPWIAATSGEVSYGYVSLDSPDLWGDHSYLWSHVNGSTESISPGGSATYSRYLIVAGRDIASVATLIHEMTATPVGTAACSVVAQSDSMPLVGATIDAYDSLDAPYLQMTTDPEGLGTATLPPGNWRLVASLQGYVAAETTVAIALNGSAGCDFVLERDAAAGTLGDTLTVIQRPLPNIPAFALPGDTLTIQCEADAAASGWAARLARGRTQVLLDISTTTYDPSTLWWTIRAAVPDPVACGLYDLAVAAGGGIDDVARHAVQVIPEFKDDYYFIHITDSHLPTHLYYYEQGADTDTSEMVDLREVIADINIINPEFVLFTGDLVNEGELEDYLSGHYYSRAQRLLTELDVPVFLTAGNHDIGGWSSTPPPAGTARRDWWRFFGWKRLADPPPGAPCYTQNYSFDYGPVHYVGLEAYDNYDMWRADIYGRDSFTSGQMQWLATDLAAASASVAQVLFYHYDFSRQLNLSMLGVEMALWGHIHRDSGNLSSQPYDLSTNNLCDGERSYRLVRVSQGALQPSPTVSAGYRGNSLDVEFEPAADSTGYSMTARVTNNLSERFEHAMLRFVMPEACDSVKVEAGTLLRIEESDSVATYYVGVDILPASTQTVTITLDTTTTAQDTTLVATPLWLGPSHPNPFKRGTVLTFTLPRSGHGRLAIFDVRGREVAVLIDKPLPAGPRSVAWDGCDDKAQPVSSGIYFARLTFEGNSRARKIVLTR
jgi:hypothetical protein